MKRIIIASDGTWNSPEDEQATNVLRLARAVAPVAADGIRQVVFYDWGVELIDKNFQVVFQELASIKISWIATVSLYKTMHSKMSYIFSGSVAEPIQFGRWPG